MSRVAGVMLSVPLETCASACASHVSTSELTAARSWAWVSSIRSQRLHDLEAYDLARAGARKLGVGEAQDADTLVRAESGADFLKMGAQVIFHCAAAFTARVGRHHQRGGLLALANFQARPSRFP